MFEPGFDMPEKNAPSDNDGNLDGQAGDARYRAAFEHCNDALFLTGLDGRILSATYYFRRRGIVVITSENFDGEWIARIIERFGYGTARGSTSHGGRRALVVSDPGIVAAGHAAAGLESLEAAGLTTALFSAFGENPTETQVAAGAAAARDVRPDLLVGLGGGSSMDCAKGINFVLTNGGAMQDYWGIGKALKEMLPMIAVPTTAGTGSEAQSFALISDAKTHVKMACGDKKAAFRIAVLDPELTVSQPPRVTALTSRRSMASLRSK